MEIIPESVQAPIVYAGFWRRFAAFLIDCVVLACIEFVFLFIFFLIFHQADGGAVAGFSVVWIGYFSWAESSKHQGTPGKRMMGLTVTDLSNKRISFWRAFGRTLAKLLSWVILMIGFFMAGFTEKKQGLHDIIAGTLVVKDRPAKKIASIFFIAIIVLIVGGCVFGYLRTRPSGLMQKISLEDIATIAIPSYLSPAYNPGYDDPDVTSPADRIAKLRTLTDSNLTYQFTGESFSNFEGSSEAYPERLAVTFYKDGNMGSESDYIEYLGSLPDEELEDPIIQNIDFRNTQETIQGPYTIATTYFTYEESDTWSDLKRGENVVILTDPSRNVRIFFMARDGWYNKADLIKQAVKVADSLSVNQPALDTLFSSLKHS